MKKNLKKLIASAVAGVMAVTMCASCGNKKNTLKTSEGKIVITVGDFFHDEKTSPKAYADDMKIVEAFEKKYPNVVVENANGGVDVKTVLAKAEGVSTTVANDESDTQALPINIFDDLGDYSWAEDAIVFLAEKSIVCGKKAKKFYPGDNITREEFVKILVNSFEIKTENVGKSAFDYVTEDTWYYPYIDTAFGCGIIKGESTSYFGLGEDITREDMATMILRAMDYANIEVAQSNDTIKFADDDDISDYAKDAVYLLKNGNVINGVGDNMFMPKKHATRAEAAKMIYAIIRH